MLVIKTQLHSTILDRCSSFSTFNMNLNKHNHDENKKIKIKIKKNIDIKSTWLEN